ncbi:MAG: ATP-binding protein [Polaromonas sp.]
MIDLEIKTRTDACEKHGDFQSKNLFRTIWSKCPACASEAAAAEKAQEEAKARAAKVAAWQRAIGDSGIPERFHTRTLATFKAENPGQRRALDFATAFAGDFDQRQRAGRGAIFIGLPGTGKTHLAVGVGMQLMKQGRPVLFATVMRAIRRIKDTWARGAEESESQAVAALVFPDLLILDEVGIQFGSETEKNLLFDVLNERYERRKSTLLLSNLTLDEVRAYLGERVFDRMREDGGECITFNWASQRAKLGEAA